MVDLGWEKAKVLTLDKELDEARKSLKAEVSKHDILCATIRVIGGSSVMTSKWHKRRGLAHWWLASSTSWPGLAR
jgi:hypothetical protein